MRHMRSFSFLLILVLALLVLLSGCSSVTTRIPEPTATMQDILPSQTVEIRPTPTATALPGKVIFIAPEKPGSSEQALLEQVRTLAEQSGLLFETQPVLQPDGFSSDWRVVVLSGHDPALSDALSANPDVQFIVFSEQELGTAPNLSVVRIRQDYQAFMSGFLSILITPDWRTGGLFTPEDTGSSQLEAFVNGAQYFCGVCSSKLSPIIRFPVTARLSEEADPGTWQPEVDALLTNILYVLYVGPGSGNPDMLQNLAERGVVLVGGETPPNEVRARWAATVSLDLASPLETIWQSAAAGEGGVVLDTPVVISDINEEFYSSGRQRLVEETLQDLEAGWIYPLDVPVE